MTLHSADAAYDDYDDDAGLEPGSLQVYVFDADEAGVIVELGDGTSERLNTNASGLADTATIRLTSKPFDKITLTVNSDNSDQGFLNNDNFVFTSDNWDVPQTLIITGQDAGDIESVLYSLAFSVGVNSNSDTAYELIKVPSVYVLNTYITTIFQFQENIVDFIDSPSMIGVWVAIGVAVLIVIILVVVVVVNRQKHKMEIKKARQEAVESKKSMVAGADTASRDITWNDEDENGIEMSNVDSIRTYEREYDGMIKKLQRETKRLLKQNVDLAKRAGVSPMNLNGAASSIDVVTLFAAIRKLKASNSDLEGRDQTNLLSPNSARKLARKKKKKKDVFGQQQI
jgi:hypothetical protein